MLFFFNDTATTEIYTLSLHDALPISVLAHCHPIGIVALALVGLVVAPFALLASECDGDSNVSAGHCEIPAWWLIAAPGEEKPRPARGSSSLARSGASAARAGCGAHAGSLTGS